MEIDIDHISVGMLCKTSFANKYANLGSQK